MLLVGYAFYTTGLQLYDMGRDDGIDVGYGAGVKRGFQEGKREACMIKPI